MLQITNWRVPFFVAVAMMGPTCFAENSDPPKFYKLEFVVKEVEGPKVLNARAYSMTVSSDSSSPASSIRTGSKVPMASSPGSSQFTFFDLGVNIDCRSIKPAQNELSLIVTADVSSMQLESPPSAASQPVIRQNRWSSVVIVPIKKPTVIFSADDLTTKRQMQLELTATPIR